MLGSKGLILVGSLNRQSIGGSHTGTGIVLLDISGEATGRGALDRSSEAETYGLGDELGPSVIEDSASGDDKRSTIRQLPLRRGCSSCLHVLPLAPEIEQLPVLNLFAIIRSNVRCCGADFACRKPNNCG